MGPDLPRSVVDGKPGVCWSDRRFFGVAENSHAIELVYLDRIMAISLNALDDESSRGGGLFTGNVTIMRQPTK
jgi:hypothetical protein